MKCALALLLALSVATPAMAERHGGRDRGAAQVEISQARALEIAAAQGVARVQEIKIDDGNWKVEGFTAEGRAIEVEIDGVTGAVLKREFYF